MNMTLLIRFILSTVLIIGLIAPFSFLVPKSSLPIDDTVNELIDKVVKQETIKKEVEVQVQAEIIEKPLHDINLPNFTLIYDIPTKKRTFFNFIRPAIEDKNNQLVKERMKLKYWHEQLSLGLGLTDTENRELQKLAQVYRINKEGSNLQQVNDLLMRVDTIPVSLVLVQAANESAWGTSRFARIGLNFFGIWCYQKGCGMVPKGRNVGAKHEVAAFKSVDEAVSGYFNNINKHNAYRMFRSIRAELRAKEKPLDAEILATGLLFYSERGAEYVLDLTNMLRHNKKYFMIMTQEVAPSDEKLKVKPTEKLKNPLTSL